MKRWLVVMGVAVLAWTTGAQAQAPVALPAGVSQVTSVEGITEYRLPNGLQVLLVPDDSKPTITVNVTYRVGSRHENYGETGMAHLLEHLLFKGTPTLRNPWAEFTKRGLRANGSTSQDRTNYFASFAANDDTLRWTLSWQADAMVNSLIARSDLDSEMTVVRNEFERGENEPGRVTIQTLLSTMFRWHNYGKSAIGARTDIENVDIARLQAFYRQYYQPDNATLIVAGSIKPAQTLAWIAQYFGPIPKPQRVLQPTYTLDPVQDGERSVTVRRAGGSPLVLAGYHTPAGADPDFAAVRVLAQVLADTPSGRLYKQLTEKKLAASVFGFGWDLAEPAVLILGAQLAPGQDPEAARAALVATTESLAREPITSEELERARTALLNDWTLGFTDPERVGVQISGAISRGDWRLYFLDRDQLRKLKLADLQRVANDYLRRDNRSIAQYLPTDSTQRAPLPAKVDVAALVKDYRGDATAAQAEAFDPSPANLDARLQTRQLASGLRVGLLPKSTRGNVVQARLRLHYGDVASLNGLETVGVLVGSLLDKGAAGLTRQQISDRFDQLQADVGFRANDQTLSVSITTTRANLPAVVTLVGQLLRQPTLPEAALDELRAQWLASIERQRKEPDSLISNALQRHRNPYPRGDLRYAPTFDESVQDVKAVTPAQLQAFHRHFYSAARAEFSAVGDLDVAGVNSALDAAFGDWKAPADGPQPYVRVPQPLVPAAPTRIVIRTPDKQNASVRGVLPLPLDDRHPDYPALSMANYIFGQSGNSRLWVRIREKDGLSYGVGTSIGWSSVEPNSSWSLSASFAPQNQAKVEAAFNEELARALKDGFTQTELDEARAGLLSARRLSRAQDAAVVGQAVQNLYLERRFAYSQQVDDALAKLTLEQINAAFRKYIIPAQLALAWGGDFKP